MSEQINVTENEAKTPEAIPEVTTKKLKLSKKNLLILLGASLVIVAVIVAIILTPSEFDKVKDEAVQIAGQISSRGNDNFTIDTYPYEDTNMDPTIIALLASGARNQALDAIKYVNEALGFNGSLYDEMLETSALMGRQREENDKYKVSWKYHPDEGLEVTYEKK